MSKRPMLTQRDHAILSGLAKQNGLVSAAYYQQLTEKLRSALIIDVDEVEPEFATIGSFVRYRVNGGRALEHKLVLQPDRRKEQHALSIKSRRGLGLLGMWQDEEITLAPMNRESPEVLELEMVLFQPEADGTAIRPGGGAIYSECLRKVPSVFSVPPRALAYHSGFPSPASTCL